MIFLLSAWLIISEFPFPLPFEEKKKEERIREEKAKKDEKREENRGKEKKEEKEEEGKRKEKKEEEKEKKVEEKNFEEISKVFLIQVEGAISPAVAEFIVEGISKAKNNGISLVVILIDTPGGLDLSMRKIIKEMESSPIPIVTYVYPVGARAASAGTFIVIAGHIAAMSPGTSIGAASPVMLGGREIDETLKKKIENDAVSYIKSLAKRHGKNDEWAEKAVREAATLTAEEALQKGVIDIVAENLEELLKKIDGKTVKTSIGEVKISTKKYEIVRFEENIKHRVLKTISDPNIAYILLMIGMWGIFFELSNPGAIFPGVVGAICLILGLYSLQTLPVNWAGLLLILLSIVLFILEIKSPTHGILGLAGFLSLVLGSFMLFKSPEPFMRASLKVILSSSIATATFFLFAVYMAIKAQLKKPMLGLEGLIGEIGEIISTDKLKVFVQGEIWNAEMEGEDIPSPKEKVKIVGIKSGKLIVKKI